MAVLTGTLCLSGMTSTLGCTRGDTRVPEATANARVEGSQDGLEGDARQAAPSTAATRPEPPGPDAAGTCGAADDRSIGILVSPKQPVKGQPVRVMVASLADETPLAVRIEDASASALDAQLRHRPGVPTTVVAQLAAAPEGRLRVVVGRDGENLRCDEVVVRERSPGPRSITGSVWPVERSWDGGEEALFSAWVRELFHAPIGEDLAWTKLDEVTSDPERNLLHDHLAAREDDARSGLYLKPDCADAPYFLRAYFAWKRGLPFAFRQCSRGGGGKAPRCGALHAVPGPPEHGSDKRKSGELGIVQRYFRRTIGWGVHSGNGRTAFGDDRSDFYPVALTRRGLRPGTIYADPYGHIFVMVEFFAPDGDEPGILYAIDGQPDGSITRKRFWEGNFLWNPDPALGGSGFKAFRPVLADGGDVRAATDAEIAKLPGYGDVSDEQRKLEPNAFYDKMDALITPGRRDAFRAQEAAVQALFEAAKVRVTSVDNAEAFLREHSGTTVPMPDGHAIFETTGAWENYSTPARDLRLLIAIDVVRNFADKVARNPDVYLAPGQSMGTLREQLDTARQALLADDARSFAYTRSDGSPWTLTVADVVARAEAFERAYNPNDCPEVRWGAPKGSEERSTCRRRAPKEQQRKVDAYSVWFDERRRPARGEPGPKFD